MASTKRHTTVTKKIHDTGFDNFFMCVFFFIPKKLCTVLLQLVGLQILNCYCQLRISQRKLHLSHAHRPPAVSQCIPGVLKVFTVNLLD